MRGPVAAVVSSAGNTRGLIEACNTARDIERDRRSLPRGIPAASLKHKLSRGTPARGRRSSAGNTRGLIEAAPVPRRPPPAPAVCLPRGIPAASLKQGAPGRFATRPGCLPRGIPAASLKLDLGAVAANHFVGSSAGNTRGLIEAVDSRHLLGTLPPSSAGNTRGLIEAESASSPSSVSPWSSAGNTRGLIEAASFRRDGRGRLESSAGNTRGLIEAPRTPSTRQPYVPVFRGEYPRPH